MFDQISLFFSTTLFDTNNKSLQLVDDKKKILFWVINLTKSNLTVQKWLSRIKKMCGPGTFSHYKLS